ncbi:MAG: gliding motility-associated C-terminal domain-containing protein, partial [Bacteroidota bacterium]|nr:gliding motility-associated C-terminal domain-containing protein [Bacteroidota bacterium]
YHVAATYDGAFLKYYVNGCLTGQMAWTGNMVQSNLITAIGNQSSCQCEQYTGYIDEVRIWNVARTQTEIQTNMNNLPTPTTQPGLLGYWKFDGSYVNLQGNPVFDGTPVGAPLFQQAPLPYPVTLSESLTSSNPICSGEANGLINVSALGFYTPYEYSLDGITFNPSPVFSGLTAGTYTVFTRPQNNNNCVVSSNIVLTDPPVLLPNLTTSNALCNGAANGTANVAPSGGDGPLYEQLWQPSLNTSTGITGLAAGNYSVAVSDTCKASGAELVTNGHFDDGNTGFGSGYICCGGGPGNYTVDVDPNYYNPGHFGSGFGGSGNYLILDGSTVPGTNFWCQTIAVTPNTNYSFSTFVSSTYSSVLAVIDFTINGVSVGSLNAPATTFTWDPFQTVWNSGSSTTATICMSDLNTIAGGNDFGVDNISFKSCASCTVNTPFTITEPAALTLTTTQTNVSCNAGTNGTATVTANGGTAGYTYSWSTTPVQTAATATGLSAGTYTVTVTDLNFCTSTTTVTIIEASGLSASISAQTNVLCNLGNTGSATVAGSGGTAPYTFSWNTVPVQTAATATNLTAGTYTATITDLNGCTAIASVTITEPPALTVGITSQTNVSCNAGTNGTATAAGNGGNPGYSYSWNSTPVQNTAIASSLSAGTYTVTVTDLNSCTATNTVTITEPTLLSVSITSQTNVSCNAGTNGTATALANGGAGSYSYSWNTTPVQTTATANSLSAGTYTVIVTDLNSCTASNTVTITEPAAVSVSITAQTNVSCDAGTNGTATASGNGGTPTYSYSWNTTPVQTTATANLLSAGTYTVTVSDLNLCTSTATVTITEPAPLILSLDTKSDPSCNGLSDGSIFTLASGGTGAYSYSWAPAVSTLASAVNIPSGSYDITLSDGNGCTDLLNVVLTDPAVLTNNASASSTAFCLGGSTTLNSTVAGGTTSYTYSWSNGSVLATQTVSPLLTNNYTVTVTDANNCTAIDSVLITVFQPAVINLGNDTAICQGDMITLNAGPGFSSYLWQNGTNLQTLNASTANLYHVSAIDPNGCLVKDSLILIINPLPVIGLSDTVRICPGLSTNLNANPAYTSYLWNTGAVTSSIPVTAAGNYVVVVQDANGCINSDSTTVRIYPVPTLFFTVSPRTGCDPLLVSTTNSSVLNGSSATWNWQIGSTNVNEFAPNALLSSPGLYNVFLQATTSNGCIVDTLISNYVEVYPAPTAMIFPEAYEYELYDDNINITNLTTGATTFDWTLFGFPVSTAFDLVYPITDTGSYNFQMLATNQFGCQDSTDVTIFIKPSFAIYFPSAFSPNGSGFNDFYMPKGYGIHEYDLMIFDRWGELVFRSKDINVGWDGTYKGGAPFKDVYVYKCAIRDPNGDPHFYIGQVTLVD